MRSRTSPSTGFTLIELSVVLVIIGLLLGAVVAGRTLIKNAELQTIISDSLRYKQAVINFKKEYNALPGDMADAEDFWGRSTSCGGTVALGVCNGDGNGVIHVTGGTAEWYQFWRELNLAGFITGTYSGITGGSSNGYTSIPGVNVPESRTKDSGWEVGNNGAIAGSIFLPMDYGHWLRIGKRMENSALQTPLLTPQEASRIDLKIDDGRPGRGSIIAAPPVGCTNATMSNQLDATYRVTQNSVQCTLFFVRQF